MRTVGTREQPRLELQASGALLKRAAAINEGLAALLPGGHQDEMLAEHMAARRSAHA